MEKINIRGIFFDNITMQEAIGQVKGFIKNKDKGLPDVIYTPNAEIVQACIENFELFDIINSSSMIIPDGAGVVLASKILKTPLKEKVAGADLSFHVMDYLNDTGGKLFLLGAEKSVLETALIKLKEKYTNITLDGHDGYFDLHDPQKNNGIISRINEFSPDAVFVCLGAPKQEKWIYDHRKDIKTGLIIGLGGMIDNYAGKIKRAPKIMIKMNLEWFYRLVKQPSRLKRMMKIPKFLFGCAVRRNK